MITVTTSNGGRSVARRRAEPARSSKPELVRRITVTLSRNGRKSQHNLYFDNDRLTLRELYEVGFLGDIEFRDTNGILEKAELEAGPFGEFQGDRIGRLAFRVRMLDPANKDEVHVVKFYYITSDLEKPQKK